MMRNFGYHNKALHINLSNEHTQEVDIDNKVLELIIGGTGLATYLLHKYCPEGTEPLEPSNPLIFASSPLVGTRLTTSSKFAIATKSPLTGLIGDSLSSSYMALELKKTGYDAIIITGKRQSNTLLTIKNNSVKFIDAKHLSSKTTSQTESQVKSLVGNQFSVCSIGIAGENMVRFASIANDGGRQAGRTGVGAVMGSKNLKAIAIHGTNKTSIYDESSINRIRANLNKKSLGPATEKYRTLGTISNLSVFNRLNVLPSYNFQQTKFANIAPITAETTELTHKLGSAHCASCTIGCEKIFTSRTESGSTIKSRLEYETAYALGPLIGISNPDILIESSNLCDQLGLDTISTGATIAWAMESYEKRVLTQTDTGGLELYFGNEKILPNLIQMIAEQKGIGRLLSEGSKRSSEQVGKSSDTWAMHVKGLEMPGYDPRKLKTMALALAVSTKGACHNRSSAYESDFSILSNTENNKLDKGIITKKSEDYSAVMDSLIWCKFVRKVFDDFYEESSEVYSSITGKECSPKQLEESGERINNLKKLFNIREGWRTSDDTLPTRVFNSPNPNDSGETNNLTREELNTMISSYYNARGWTQKGTITKTKIQSLSLDYVLQK
ncbi:MAG: aldehyde ferredoxin oxidoreductase family protein [SAR202 cluster bacterium]|nr:aldehyde ferredoxin oxidoreductase family protein [SAR202 cluster bacterium]|tara:strand:- start:36495 stop:38333 length:1839 start_codon:yes stop_codon:yes gene_type:complete